MIKIQQMRTLLLFASSIHATYLLENKFKAFSLNQLEHLMQNVVRNLMPQQL